VDENVSQVLLSNNKNVAVYPAMGLGKRYSFKSWLIAAFRIKREAM